MTKVLVTAASKHGATEEIGAAIGKVLADRGVEVTLAAPDEVDALDGYDAAVVGSAVYAGHWMKEARGLVERLRPQLQKLPVWLFSSGPIGDPPKPEVDPVDAAEVSGMIGARQHRLFAGKLDKSRLGLGERAMVAALRAPEGDFRPWEEIEAWAGEIADALTA